MSSLRGRHIKKKYCSSTINKTLKESICEVGVLGPGNLCRLMATNLKRSLKLQASGRKCINVRYEDVALYPLESAADIYETLGIELSTELMRWIEQNTEHTAAKRFPNKVKRGKLQACRFYNP